MTSEHARAARRALPGCALGAALVAGACGLREAPASVATDPAAAVAAAGLGTGSGTGAGTGSGTGAEPGSGAISGVGSGSGSAGAGSAPLTGDAKPISGSAQTPRAAIDPAAAERGVLARVTIPSITSTYEADRIVAVERAGDGFALAVADPPGPGAGFTVHRVVPGLAQPTASTPWLDDGLGHWVGLVGGAFVQIEHVGQGSRVNVDGQTAVIQHGDLRHVAATRCGDRLVLCGIRSDDAGAAVVCGDVTPRREWTEPTPRIVLAGTQVRAMALASSPESDGLLVATERLDGTGSRLVGDWLDCATLEPMSAAFDLAGEPWSSGPDIAIPSLWGGSRQGERFWAFGSNDTHFARAGRVGADGSRRMAQVDPPGGVSSRPQLVASGARWVVVHDEYGRRGERTAVVWGADRPIAAEITLAPDLLPNPGSNFARLGAAGAGVLAVVVESGDGAQVVLLDPDTLFGPAPDTAVESGAEVGSGAVDSTRTPTE